MATYRPERRQKAHRVGYILTLIERYIIEGVLFLGTARRVRALKYKAKVREIAVRCADT